VLTEVDGDGHADAYIVQNFFGPQLETGQMDGRLSLLLRGRGDGIFTAVRPAQSGLVVPEDAKGLAVTDLTGPTSLLASTMGLRSPSYTKEAMIRKTKKSRGQRPPIRLSDLVTIGD
jgi:hypothetical protein